MPPRSTVVVLDHGLGNLRSAVRALERVGASVELTGDRRRAEQADGLVVPGVGAFAAVMAALKAVRGDDVIVRRLQDNAPVLGICVGMQVLFEQGEEHGVSTRGLGLLPGSVTRLNAPVVPHMGWSSVEPPAGSALFAGLAGELFYFVHSYAARIPDGASEIGWSRARHGEEFCAALEAGALNATQFHPEKSADAGLALLTNWVGSL